MSLEDCKSCKWWGEESVSTPGWRICELARSSRNRSLVSTTKAIAQDFEGFEAYLETAPDYGCVQYESLPEGLTS